MRKMKEYFNIGIFIISLVFSSALNAEQTVDSDGFSLWKHDTIYVVADQPIKKTLPSELLLNTIELQDITTRDLGDVLTRYEGVDVTVGGSKGNKEIKLRGAYARGVLITLNGRPINTGYYGKVDFNDLPVYNIESVQIVKGPAPARYGINNYTGVINLKTRKATKLFSTRLSGDIASGGFVRTKAIASSILGPLNLSLSGSWRKSDGTRMSADYGENEDELPEALEDGLAPNSEFEHSEGEFKAEYKQTDLATGLSFGVYKGFRQFAFTLREFDDIQRFSPAGWLSYKLPRIQMRVDGFYDYYYDRFQEHNRSYQVVWDSKLWCYTTGSKAEITWQNPLGTAYFGGGVKWDKIEKKPHEDAIKYQRNLVNHHIFLEQAYNPLENLSIDIGVVGSYFSNDGRGDTSLTITELNAGAFETTKSYLRLDPSISVNYKPLSGLTVYGAAGNYVRYPTIHQLYSDESGNPQLNPERALKTEAGFRYVFSTTPFISQVTGSAFHTSYKAMIDRDLYADEVFYNMEDGDIKGLESKAEFEIIYGLFKALRTTLGIEYLTGSRPDILNYAPKIKYTARLGYGFKIANVSVTPVFSSFYFYKRVIDEYETWAEAEYLPDYTLFDASLTLKWKYFETGVYCYNLLDRNYYEEWEYPAPGRNLVFKLSIEL